MKKNELLLTAPSFFWLMIFFVIPAIIALVISFRGSDSYGIIVPEWTLRAYFSLLDSNLIPAIVRTIRLSFFTTLFCLLIGLPAAYALSRMSRKTQITLLMFLVIPFWTNFLIRIYAWKVLLHPDGLIKNILVFLHLISENATLLYSEGAVLLVLVYTYLPFALLPLYSASENFDFTLLEAARDLGANTWQIIFRIYLPGIKQGIINAVLVVFIPALGSYIIPEIVGGPNSEMLGNKIARYVFTDRNLPRAGALSGILLLIILLPSLVSILNKTIPGKGEKGPLAL